MNSNIISKTYILERSWYLTFSPQNLALINLKKKQNLAICISDAGALHKIIIILMTGHSYSSIPFSQPFAGNFSQATYLWGFLGFL